MGKLKIVVLYDRVLVDEGEESAASEKSPVVRTLDKKEVEEEVAEALTKLGHEPVMYELDGTQKSLLGLAGSIATSCSTWPSRLPTTTRPTSRSRLSSSCSGRTYTGIRHPRADAGAGQGHREEDLRVSRHSHAGRSPSASAAGSTSRTICTFRSSSSRRARTAPSASSSAPSSTRSAS